MKHSSERLILVVEDDEPKLKSILELLAEIRADQVSIHSVGALSSAIKTLSTRDVALAIVDMSIPSFEATLVGDGGGQPQGFGGADILRFIAFETSETKAIVLTQYEEFPATREGGIQTLGDLASTLHTQLGSRFLGLVHYTGRHGGWREQVRSLILNLGFGDAP